jgi:DNA-binding transcriptional LysR family regulator
MQDLKAGIRLAGTEALKNFIREDDCIGFLPKGSIKRELKDGDLVSIRIEKIKIERNFFFIQRQGTQNNELNRSFIRFCKQHI